jgi:toxin ParE1/3/4
MTRAMGAWTVRLTAAAEADFGQILTWTREQFGEPQAFAYADTLALALEALHKGPETSGVKSRDDILRGLSSLHVARQGQKGRHFIMFRTARNPRTNVIEVLRILHDSMDLPRHVRDERESR